MSNLVAKPIIKNQLWVITDGVTKVGNIEANSSHTGYNVKIGDQTNFFSSTKKIERSIELTFEKPQRTKRSTDLTYAQWPTESKTYNNFYDVSRKIHVYTKTPASKCYYVAGYFNIKVTNSWQTQFCPKYIFIQRYPYQGPYHTELDAVDMLNKT
jgi:hypothetical protein